MPGDRVADSQILLGAGGFRSGDLYPVGRDRQRQAGRLIGEARAGQPVAQEFLRYLHEFLSFALPAYVGEGKTRLTIALGCTGGYHRSIALAEALADWLREQDFGPVAVFHRELERA